MTQFEKRLLKDGFSPAEVEKIEAAEMGTTVNVYVLGKEIYAQWDKDFRYAVHQKTEMAALKRLLRLYDPDQIVELAQKKNMGTIMSLSSVASNFTPQVTFSPEFEIEEGYRFNGPQDAFAKEAAFVEWKTQQEEQCRKQRQQAQSLTVT